VTWVTPTVVAETKMVGKSGSTIVLAKQPVHLGADVLSACVAPLTAYLQQYSTVQQYSTADVAVTVVVGDALAAAAAAAAAEIAVVEDVLAAAGGE